MEAFLTEVLPTMLGEQTTFSIHTHQGKPDLLRKLPARLKGYARWLPAATRIVVLVDRDDDDCAVLKRRLEEAAEAAGLATRAVKDVSAWRVLNRIAVEELEAWFFGNWGAVRSAYPKVTPAITKKASYRNCDAIPGGTWEAFERVLKQAGYFEGGLRKVEAAKEIGSRFEFSACTSPSFITLKTALIDAIN